MMLINHKITLIFHAVKAGTLCFSQVICDSMKSCLIGSTGQYRILLPVFKSFFYHNMFDFYYVWVKIMPKQIVATAG